MKKIEAFENAIANECKDLKAACINPTVFWAYRHAMRNGNEQLDFSEVIWDEDVEVIAATFETNGIAEFTISSNFSGLIKILVAFEQHGFRMVGTTEVKANYTDWQTGEFARIPALRMQKV